MPARLVLPFLCLVTLACGGAADETVAYVGDVPLSLAELEQYLALNLLTDEEDPAATRDLDRVKSRLFDALVDEKRLLREAERIGLEVSEQEVSAYLKTEDEEHPAVPWLSEERRGSLVRQRLLVQKLQEHVAGRLPPPTEDEIQAYIGESQGRLTPRKRVLLRSLRFESVDDAALAAVRIGEGRMSFAEAVKTYERDPGQGVLLEFSWAALPDNIRAALDGLKPSEVSRPVRFNGDAYLFQLEAWRTNRSQMDEDMIRLARDELIRRRRREAGERLRHQLRVQTPVRIHEDRLPFRYVSDAGA